MVVLQPKPLLVNTYHTLIYLMMINGHGLPRFLPGSVESTDHSTTGRNRSVGGADRSSGLPQRFCLLL